MSGPKAEGAIASPAELFQRASKSYDAKDYRQALHLIEQAVVAAPNEATYWNAKGVILRVMGRLPEAASCLHRALQYASELGGTWSNLGNVLKDQKHFQSSIRCHERAIALKPTDADILHNHGVALAAAQRYREAIQAFNRALIFKPGATDILWDRALSHLHLGDFAAGWLDYDARLVNGLLPIRKLPGQTWRRQRFADRHLLITAEQGFGDAIWAARFFPLVKALGGTITLECQPELIPLFETMGAIDRFVPKGAPLPSADWHCSICSLPGLFTPDPTSISGVAYLKADSDRVSRLTTILDPAGKKRRVGIVWSGSVTFKGNADRATELERFVNAFNLPDIQLYSLQKGKPAEALAAQSGSGIVDLRTHLRDFADAAAAVSCMDLIVMTDSAIAHLAGALGKPVWILLGAAPYWLWRPEGADNPWYSSATLFRQKAHGDWIGPFDEAANRMMCWTPSDDFTR